VRSATPFRLVVPLAGGNEVVEPPDLTVRAQSQLLARRELSAVELVRMCLERVQETDTVVGAFVTVLESVALARAEAADAAVRRGQSLGSLHGIPYTVKDNIDVAGLVTAAGSDALWDRLPDRSAACVRRLDAAGAILIGKVRLYELAYSQANVSTCNPWRRDRIAGNSSAGSAAAVATGMGSFSIGTDTGGSIRIPAALCGVVGFKPTFGRISRAGVVPLAWSLDHVGPLARSVADCEFIAEVLAVYDPDDEDSIHVEKASMLPKTGIAGVRLGVVRPQDLAEEVKSAVDEAAIVLTRAGAELEEFSPPDPECAADVAAVLTNAEAAACHGWMLRERAHLLGEDVRRRLLLGSTHLASEYIRAQRVQAVYRQRFASAMEGLDAVVMPTTGITAPDRSAAESAVVRSQLVRFTAFGNVLGAPCVNIPAGLSNDGLPVGLQVLGRPHDDVRLMSIAQAVEELMPAPRWAEAISRAAAIPS